MIVGVGTDIIEIYRIESLVNKNKNFIEKIFTDEEVIYFQSRSMRYETIAGNFAAKEAISKALGTGIRGFSFKDIEILRDKLGKPIVNLKNEACIIAQHIAGEEYKVHLSISHSKENAIAYAILERKVDEDRYSSRN